MPDFFVPSQTQPIIQAYAMDLIAQDRQNDLFSQTAPPISQSQPEQPGTAAQH